MLEGTDQRGPREPINLRHVGIIPDGVRRWSRREGVDLRNAYSSAIDLAVSHTAALWDLGVPYVSLYLLSTENLERPAAEVEILLDLMVGQLPDKFAGLADRHNASVVIAGDSTFLSGKATEAFRRLQGMTKPGAARVVHLCIAYSPWLEIVAALRGWEPERQPLLERMWVPVPLDVVVRTGGGSLLSNFLPLQSGYAYLIVIDELFPEFSTGNLVSSMRAFADTVRLHGK